VPVNLFNQDPVHLPPERTTAAEFHFSAFNREFLPGFLIDETD